MKISKLKKALSMILVILMMVTSLPVTVFSAEENYGVMEVYTAASSADYHKYYNSVYSVTFCDYIDEAAVAEGEAKNPQFAWDVSVDKDRSVMAWMKENADVSTASSKKYDVYIGAEGGVKANPNSSWMFYLFASLKEIRNPENFKTSRVTTFYNMFKGCTALEEVDFSCWETDSLTNVVGMFSMEGAPKVSVLRKVNLSGWNVSKVTSFKDLFNNCQSLADVNLSDWKTSSATSMENMFKNCYELTELDLTSFDTSKVTTMRFMFYLCKKLEFIYAGDGWTTESIANLYDGVFNCCYAKFGVTEEQYAIDTQNGIQYDASANKVCFEEDGGYLTKAYNVEYVFHGDIPEGKTAPEKVLYPIGVGKNVTVTVKGQDVPVGYTFSGWETDDADISAGSFVIENDVVIEGTWEKIPEYKVTYVYEGDVPRNAPELPEEKTYLKGSDVTVAEEPGYPGYTFSGWSTEDADISADSFEIENDVVIVGTWEKIKAENIEVEIEGSDDDSWIELKPGEETKITVNVKPDGVIEKGVTFESSDENVVTVDKDGNVTATGEGKAIITITSEDNEKIFVEVNVEVKYTRYKVTYAYEGNVPETAPEVPEDALYIEGTTVRVENAPTADGYVFSGWKTADATVKNGEFVINNDVHFVGSWEKVYKVYYRYDERYPVPEGAMALPEEGITYKAGDEVELTGVMYYPEHVFIGWYTDDVEIAGDMFEMPENDVVLYGYFKKPVESIEFIGDEETIILSPDASEKLQYYVKPEDATIKDIVFETSDDSVVTVDDKGNITAVKEGEATVTVRSADDPTKSDTITVVVKKIVTEIEVDKEEVVLYVGETEKVTGTVNEDATNKNVIYDSVDPTVATVDENGNITAVSGGTTTIIVKSEDDENIFKTVEVTVKEPVTEITVDNKKTEVLVDDFLKIEASVNENATEKGLIYESDNPEIAKVSADGTVIGLKEGTATITVKSVDNPEVTETVEVTVYKNYTVTYMFVGEAPNVELPADKTYKTGENVTVADNYADTDGYTFSGWSTEDADITSGSFNIYNDVVIKGSWTIPVSAVIPDRSEITIEEGKTDIIKVTVTPDDATEKEVTFTSNDEDIVKVDENGNITAVKEGTAVIFIASKDGSASATVVVIVNKAEPVVPEEPTEPEEPTTKPEDPSEPTDPEEPTTKPEEPTDPTVPEEPTTKPEEPTDPEEPTTKPEEPTEPEYTLEAPESVVFTEGETLKLGVVVKPAEGAPAVKYTSSDESIVTVDADGNIKAIKSGKAVIIAELPNGEFRTINVTVNAVVKKSHYIVFGKTEKIGWYSVSMDGGNSFQTVFGNSNLEVAEGTELIIRANDVFGDPFTFYINGKAAIPDENGYVRVTVESYMLIGALGIPVVAPDAEESLSLFEQIAQAFRNFFAKIAAFFRGQL